MNTFKVALFSICFLGLTIHLASAQSTGGVNLKPKEINVKHDFGRVMGLPLVSKDFLLDMGEQPGIVASVSKSCGCTEVALKKGDTVTKNTQVKLGISLTGKPMGEGEQAVSISFEDGREFHIAMTYNYIPPPSAEPRVLVFRSFADVKNISLSYPSENDIKLVSLKSNAVWTIKTAEYKDQKLNLTLSPRDTSTPREGKIEIATTSTRLPLIKIPYLILKKSD